MWAFSKISWSFHLSGGPCCWTDWIDKDDPADNGDFESAPKDCNFVKYEIQVVDSGVIYTNVASLTNNATIIPNKGFACPNYNQPDCDTKLNGATPLSWWNNPSYPDVPEKCCKDYEVKFCC